MTCLIHLLLFNRSARIECSVSHEKERETAQNPCDDFISFFLVSR